MRSKKNTDRYDQLALNTLALNTLALNAPASKTPSADKAPRDPDFELKDRLKNLLAYEEGRIVNSAGLHVAYRDSKGIATIGYGFNLEDGSAAGVLAQVTTTPTTTLIAKTAFLTEEEAQALLFIAEDVAVKGVRPFFPDYVKLDMPRRVVLAAMVYQMGAERFGHFRRLIPAVQQQDWTAAVQSMEQSQWFRSDSPKRARRMADAMQTGTFPPFAVLSDGSKGPLMPRSRPSAASGPGGPVPTSGQPPKAPVADTRRSPWPFDN